ncbi:hypothetical protein NE865_12964 [Phthorimaea operculella]|nr:hypothetical protein NE865_12964 [Phthorimaea operculella]
MEVSNKIKEEITKTQSALKNAIRVHQIWVARLQEDENNMQLKSKVKEAERDIIAIGQTQKLVVERLRRELELYQQRLKVRNKQVNIENDNRYVAQQLREHQLHYRGRTRSVSLLKPSVLNEIHIKSENNHDEKGNLSDSDNEMKSNDKDYSNHSDGEEKDKYARSYSQMPNTVNSRSNFANALNKVKESLIGSKLQQNNDQDNENDQDQMEWQDRRSDSEYSGVQHSPTPSPPPLPEPGDPITQETFLRLVGLVTHAQKEVMEKKRSERRKRSTTSTNRSDFLYGNFDMMTAKRKKIQFPYLQPHHDPPQTRSAKLRKQQHQTRSSREGSPSGSSSENKGSGWSNGKPAWARALPASLSVEPVYAPAKKVCHGCGRSDVPSLLVWCLVCGVCVHTGCGVDGRCSNCRASLPDPPASAPAHQDKLYRGQALQR